MREQWDRRFGGEDYFYGTEPNRFVAASLDGLAPGRVLLLGEGEGRNAVHAAALGHDVTAVDYSVEGRRKTLRLADERGVAVDYRVADALDEPWHEERWDTIVLCFLHLPPEDRRLLHRRVAGALAPGGRLILESFAKDQLDRGTGGPPKLEWLHDLDELREDFSGLELTRAEHLEVELDEGPGHRGVAAVNRLVGTRKAGRERA